MPIKIHIGIYTLRPMGFTFFVNKHQFEYFIISKAIYLFFMYKKYAFLSLSFHVLSVIQSKKLFDRNKKSFLCFISSPYSTWAYDNVKEVKINIAWKGQQKIIVMNTIKWNLCIEWCIDEASVENYSKNFLPTVKCCY